MEAAAACNSHEDECSSLMNGIRSIRKLKIQLQSGSLWNLRYLRLIGVAETVLC